MLRMGWEDIGSRNRHLVGLVEAEEERSSEACCMAKEKADRAGVEIDGKVVVIAASADAAREIDTALALA
jgi:hypothetical protein